MYKYFATKANVTQVVIELQDDLLNFADYGSCVTEPTLQRLVYGWVEVGSELPGKQVDSLGLLKA